ncbi:10103_t:CDS:1, partial [Cetraspora pellucida]
KPKGKLVQKPATSELSFSENNLYVETTKESTQITEKQDEHMLASSYSSDAEEEILLDPETEPPNNASSNNK